MEEYEASQLKQIAETKKEIQERMAKIEQRFTNGVPHSLSFETRNTYIDLLALKEIVKKYEKDYIMTASSSDYDNGDFIEHEVKLTAVKRIPCQHCHGTSNC